jgi:hypothetical protein
VPGKSSVPFVQAVLKSGQPFTPFTETDTPIYSFLRSEQVSVCSRKTFGKIAMKLTDNALNKLSALIKGQKCFLSIDSSPTKDGRNFITGRIHFIRLKGNDPAEYKDIHFGLMIANGIVSKEDYKTHIKARLSVFGARSFNWINPMSNYPDDEWEKSDTIPYDDMATIVGGSSDMGPGALQAFHSLFGTYATGCDTAHGQNNIAKAAPNASEVFQSACQDALELVQSMRGDSKVASAIKALGKNSDGTSKLKIPPKFKNIRWGAQFKVNKYVTDNWDVISKLKVVEKTKVAKVSKSIGVLRHSVLLSEILTESQTFLQELGPCDALFIPYHMMKTLARVNTLQLDANLRPVQALIVARFHRRFFDKLLNVPSSYGGIDQTRRYSFFDNIFVCALWALLPPYLSNFEYFVKLSLMESSTALDLKLRCQDRLLRIHRVVDPGYFDRGNGNHASSSHNQFDLATMMLANQNSQALNEHEQERDAFRNLRGVSDCVVRNTSDMYHAPADKRRSLMNGLIFEGQKIADWIPKILRVVLACSLSTVECERDFSWLQRLIDDRRMNMSDAMIAAYMFGNKAPHLLCDPEFEAQLNQPRNKRKPKEKTEKELGNRKIDSFFGSKVLVNPSDLIESAEASALESSGANEGLSEGDPTVEPNHDNAEADDVMSSSEEEDSSAGIPTSTSSATDSSPVDEQAQLPQSTSRKSQRQRTLNPLVAAFIQRIKGRKASREMQLRDRDLVEDGAIGEEIVETRSPEDISSEEDVESEEEDENDDDDE